MAQKAIQLAQPAWPTGIPVTPAERRTVAGGRSGLMDRTVLAVGSGRQWGRVKECLRRLSYRGAMVDQ